MGLFKAVTFHIGRSTVTSKQNTKCKERAYPTAQRTHTHYQCRKHGDIGSPAFNGDLAAKCDVWLQPLAGIAIGKRIDACFYRPI